MCLAQGYNAVPHEIYCVGSKVFSAKLVDHEKFVISKYNVHVNNIYSYFCVILIYYSRNTICHLKGIQDIK